MSRDLKSSIEETIKSTVSSKRDREQRAYKAKIETADKKRRQERAEMEAAKAEVKKTLEAELKKRIIRAGKSGDSRVHLSKVEYEVCRDSKINAHSEWVPPRHYGPDEMGSDEPGQWIYYLKI